MEDLTCSLVQSNPDKRAKRLRRGEVAVRWTTTPRTALLVKSSENQRHDAHNSRAMQPEWYAIAPQLMFGEVQGEAGSRQMMNLK